jgi:uncharacterized membrane protein (Fun14 family)
MMRHLRVHLRVNGDIGAEHVHGSQRGRALRSQKRVVVVVVVVVNISYLDSSGTSVYSVQMQG